MTDDIELIPVTHEFLREIGLERDEPIGIAYLSSVETLAPHDLLVTCKLVPPLEDGTDEWTIHVSSDDPDADDMDEAFRAFAMLGYAFAEEPRLRCL